MTNTRLDDSGYWFVPTCRIGPNDFPRIVLGDHGFLRKYGSAMSLPDVVAKMSFALRHASLGLAAGDERCLRAATRAALANGMPSHRLCLFHHADIHLHFNGRRAHFGRSMATLCAFLSRKSPLSVDQDPIVGAFLRSYDHYRPYTSCEIACMDSNRVEDDRTFRLIAKYEPTAVSVGGDYLDVALASGRYDIALKTLQRYKRACDAAGASLVLTTYFAALVDQHELKMLLAVCDGILAPVNLAGMGMLPDRDRSLRWLQSIDVPVLSMHPLGSGHLPPASSLRYVLGDAGCAVAIAGASSESHITTLLSAAHAALEGGAGHED